MNWGDPATATNFWRTITRRQYMSGGHSGVTATLHELATSAGMLWHQWFAGLLALAVVGLVVLFRRRRPWFWFSFVFLVAMGPLVTIVTDFPVATADRAVNADNRALVSVFYIPSYLMIATLIAVGGWWLAALVAQWLGSARCVAQRQGRAQRRKRRGARAPAATARRPVSLRSSGPRRASDGRAAGACRQRCRRHEHAPLPLCRRLHPQRLERGRAALAGHGRSRPVRLSARLRADGRPPAARRRGARPGAPAGELVPAGPRLRAACADRRLAAPGRSLPRGGADPSKPARATTATRSTPPTTP